MHDDGYDRKPDEYFRQNLYVYRLGCDHRKLELGVYGGITKRDLQRHDKHAVRAALA